MASPSSRASGGESSLAAARKARLKSATTRGVIECFMPGCIVRHTTELRGNSSRSASTSRLAPAAYRLG